MTEQEIGKILPGMKDVRESLWEDAFRRLDFTFMDRAATLILPDGEVKGARWVLKTEYFDAFPNLEREMLRRGWCRAHLKARERCGTDAETDLKIAFIRYLSEQCGLASRCVPVGMSCGGLQAVKLAARAPELVSALYLDAPVMNFLSWPFGLGDCPTTNSDKAREELLTAYGIDRSGLICFREHPMDKIPALVRHRIPVVMVYGDSDLSVPYPENGALLERAYREADLPLALFCKEGCGHHPHGLEDPTPIAEFIERYGG